MAHANAAWGAEEEHCPEEGRPGNATDAELWLNKVMMMMMIIMMIGLNSMLHGVETDHLLFGLLILISASLHLHLFVIA